MGSYLHTHLGPYIIVKGTKKILKDKSVNTCVNVECEHNEQNKEFSQAEKFCTKCGNSISIKKYKENISLDAYDLYLRADEHVDKLHHTGHNKEENEQVFTANHRLPLALEKVDLESCPYNGVDVRNVEFEKEIQVFKEYYKDVLDMFRAELGEDCIEYRWGLLTWYY